MSFAYLAFSVLGLMQFLYLNKAGVIFPFYSWKDWGSEKLYNLLEVLQQRGRKSKDLKPGLPSPGLGSFLNTLLPPVTLNQWEVWKFLSLKPQCECFSLGTRTCRDILISNDAPHQACLPRRPDCGSKTLAGSLATKLISIPINFNVCVHMSPSLFSPWVIFKTLL